MTKEAIQNAGGAATTSGIRFQAEIGALLATHTLCEQPLGADWGATGDMPTALYFETSAPVDDILVETSTGRRIYIQAKTHLDLSKQPKSALLSCFDQAARLLVASRLPESVTGKIDEEVARIAFVTSDTSSISVRVHLRKVLERAHTANSLSALENALTNKEEKTAFSVAREAITECLNKAGGATEADILLLLKLIRVVPLAIGLGGADRRAALTQLGSLVEEPSQAPAAWDVLIAHAEDLMRQRSGSPTLNWRQHVLKSGIRLLAPRSYREDVERIAAFSETVLKRIQAYEYLESAGIEVRVPRECVGDIVSAAQQGHLLIIGEPGAGKSGAMATAAAKLSETGRVIALAVDELAVSDLDTLRTHVGLTHSFADVLANIPSKEPLYLIIDALDASRGGPSEQAIVALITQVMDTVQNCTIIATVREFDLRLGRRFQTAFKGQPPIARAASANFPSVRHVLVRVWTDDELSDLSARAPKLGKVIGDASPTLTDILRVPFNTRLAAELLDQGIPEEDFNAVAGQVELLDLYWRVRVDHLGPSAGVSLDTAVKSMVARHELRCPTADIAPNAEYQELLRIHLLITVNNDRFVAFRHHLLFDYAVSRYLLDPAVAQDFKYWTHRDREAGLLIGPGCNFALARLWSKAEDRYEFWRVDTELGGDDQVDPIVRAVSGRLAAQFPKSANDVAALVKLVAGATTDRALNKSLRTIVASLVSLADEQQPRAPWLLLASEILKLSSDNIYLARAILMWSLKQKGAHNDGVIGQLARDVLNTAVAIGAPSTALVVPAIEAVAKTYATAPSASRLAIEQLLTKERLEARAPDEMPWVARQIEPIADADPSFAVRIYEVIFGFDVSEVRERPMGDSRILPLLSNTRQDYEMSRWSLVEAFPTLLKRHPQQAVSVLVAATRATINRERSIPDDAPLQHIQIHGVMCPFQEDLSYIWASDPHDRYARDAEKMLQQFVDFAREIDGDTLLELIIPQLPHLYYAVLWARVLMVAAERGDQLSELLYEAARSPVILLSGDTKKDAIDVLGVVLAKRTAQEVEATIAVISAYDYSKFKYADDTRASTEKRLRSVIRRGRKLAEPIVDPDENGPHPVDQDDDEDNSRLSRSYSWSGGRDDEWWWLRGDVDVDAEPQASLLKASKTFSDYLATIENVEAAEVATDIAERVTQLIDQRKSKPDAHSRVVEYLDDVLARAAERIIDAKDVRDWPENLAIAREAALLAVRSANPKVEDVDKDDARDNISWSSPAPRLEAAQALIALARIEGQLDDQLRTTLDALLADPSSAVRDQIAVRLSFLWDVDRDLMWSHAKRVAEHDRSSAVLTYFAHSFLSRVLPQAPEMVEDLLEVLTRRVAAEPDRFAKLQEYIANYSAWLWLGYDSSRSHARIEGWLSNVVTHWTKLEDIVQYLRADLVLGIGANDAKKDKIRSRTQEIARRSIEEAAAVLTLFMAKTETPTDEENEVARNCAKLIDSVGMQMFFAFAPRGELGKRENAADPLLFLTETKPILSLLAEHGTPHTTHQLLELLETLAEAAPDDVWDLIAQAILKGGRTHGYVNESLGVDLYVRVVGRYLADYKGVFDDPVRRRTLLETLEAFNENGWGAARKLLNDLPDLLR